MLCCNNNNSNNNLELVNEKKREREKGKKGESGKRFNLEREKERVNNINSREMSLDF